MTPRPKDLLLTDQIGPFGLTLAIQRAPQNRAPWSRRMEPTGQIEYALIRTYDDTDPTASAFEKGFGFFPGEETGTRYLIKEAGMQQYLKAVRELIYQLDEMP